MTKNEKDRFKQCQQVGCRYFYRCTIHWGKECSYQQGKRIPRIITGPLVVTLSKRGNVIIRSRRNNDVMFG